MFSLNTKVPSLREREERFHMPLTAPNNPPRAFTTIAVQEALEGRMHELILGWKWNQPEQKD